MAIKTSLVSDHPQIWHRRGRTHKDITQGVMHFDVVMLTQV